MEHIPLRIEWRLATPWCPPTMGLHLDGLIGFALKEEAEAQGRAITSFDELLSDLPFEKHVTAMGWVWKASYVRPTEVFGTERRYLTAKTNAQGLAERMVDGQILGRALGKIDRVRGLFLNNALWYNTEHVPALVAWCVGDPDRLLSLLDRITHIGKRSRIDHGRIAQRSRTDESEAGLDFTLEEDEAALEKWRLRVMPEHIDGYIPVATRLNPPYWAGESQQMGWRPA